MEREKTKKIIHASVCKVQDLELKNLDSLYSKKPEELRSVERDELIRRTLRLPLTAEKELKNALQSAGVPYIATIWKKVSELLPDISYTYIDWNSLDNGNSHTYSREVSEEDIEKVKKGGSIFVIPGCLLAGSIVLIRLISKNHPLTKLQMFVIVVAVVGGFMLIRALFPKEKKDILIQPAEQHSGQGQLAAAVSSAQQINQTALKEWCQKFEQISWKVCQEAEE